MKRGGPPGRSKFLEIFYVQFAYQENFWIVYPQSSIVNHQSLIVNRQSFSECSIFFSQFSRILTDYIICLFWDKGEMIDKPKPAKNDDLKPSKLYFFFNIISKSISCSFIFGLQFGFLIPFFGRSIILYLKSTRIDLEKRCAQCTF